MPFPIELIPEALAAISACWRSTAVRGREQHLALEPVPADQTQSSIHSTETVPDDDPGTRAPNPKG